MSISNQDVHHIARLARLGISPEEVEVYADNLSQILDLVARMNDVDTDNIEPMAHPSDLSLRLRKDTVSEADQRDEFMDIAPASENGLYLVPKVIE